MASRKYLLLMSVSKANANAAKAVLANIHRAVDSNAAPLWIDAHGVGVFIESDMPATDMWGEAFLRTEDFNDAIIVEIGPDWIGRKEAKTTNWLKSHLGYPLFSQKGRR